MKTIVLCMGLLLSVAVIAAPKEPRVACKLYWSSVGKGDVILDSYDMEGEITLPIEGKKWPRLEFHGFTFKGRVNPMYLDDGQVSGYKLDMALNRGESATLHSSKLQPNVRYYKLRLVDNAAKDPYEVVLAICVMFFD